MRRAIVGVAVAALLVAGVSVAATWPPAEEAVVVVDTTATTQAPTDTATTTTAAAAPPPPTSTTHHPAETTTTQRSAATTSTTGMPPPGARACGADDLEVTTATDRATYPRDVPVMISATARNIASDACVIETNQCGALRVRDEQDEPIWSEAGQVCLYWSQRTMLLPGETFTYTASWDQRVCWRHSDSSRPPCDGGPPAAPGVYRAAAIWKAARRAATGAEGTTVTFTLTG